MASHGHFIDAGLANNPRIPSFFDLSSRRCPVGAMEPASRDSGNIKEAREFTRSVTPPSEPPYNKSPRSAAMAEQPTAIVAAHAAQIPHTQGKTRAPSDPSPAAA